MCLRRTPLAPGYKHPQVGAQVRGLRGVIGRVCGCFLHSHVHAHTHSTTGLRQLAAVEVSGGERVLRRDKFSINGRVFGWTGPLSNTHGRSCAF